MSCQVSLLGEHGSGEARDALEVGGLDVMRDAQAVDAALAKMSKVAGKVRVGLNILLGAYLVFNAIALVVVLIGLDVDAFTDMGSAAASVVFQFLPVVVVSILLVVLSSSFKDVSVSKTPFSIKNAKRLNFPEVFPAAAEPASAQAASSREVISSE